MKNAKGEQLYVLREHPRYIRLVCEINDCTNSGIAECTDCRSLVCFEHGNPSCYQCILDAEQRAEYWEWLLVREVRE